MFWAFFGLVVLAWCIDEIADKVIKQWQGRPRDNYPPTLSYNPSTGKWRAVWRVDDAGSVVGVGESPEEALDDFDKDWRGENG